ncbi:hypothetical protein K8354_17960 [Polaribacter litorisediminis]|uniref:hypothetical protein n=1 Tax=Polaribacter litorisediminis TaxID=1908341 RepID=UPI001CBAFD0E|nr:hypothetical protein [Polaribacter litorisediminis]UAM98137.1 hypothetical protein K8354_17960 [Polaribacter litorisediminis]
MREIIREIIEDLNIEVNYQQYNLRNQSDFYINEVIKTLFATKGTKLGYKNASKKNILANLDFLFDDVVAQFDLEWFKLVEEDNLSIKTVSLVLESKLDSYDFDEFKLDFTKFIEEKNATKVFVTLNKSIKEKVKFIQKLIDDNIFFSLNDNLYLIIYCQSENGEFLLKEF